MKVRTQFFLAAIFAVGMSGIVSVHAAQAQKIAVVGMQKAIQSVTLGQKAKSTLEKEFNKRKAELEKDEKGILQLRDELQKQALVMNDETRNKKQGELQQKVAEFQQKMAKSQAEIQEREASLTGPIIEKMRDIIQEVAKKKGYNNVLDKSANVVLYWEDKDDLTEEVIEAFNKKHKS